MTARVRCPSITLAQVLLGALAVVAVGYLVSAIMLGDVMPAMSMAKRPLTDAFHVGTGAPTGR